MRPAGYTPQPCMGSPQMQPQFQVPQPGAAMYAAGGPTINMRPQQSGLMQMPTYHQVPGAQPFPQSVPNQFGSMSGSMQQDNMLRMVQAPSGPQVKALPGGHMMMQPQAGSQVHIPPRNPALANLPVVVAGDCVPPPAPEAATDAVNHDFQVGDWVRLAGMAFNADYQEKPFQVETPNVGDGRVMVKFQHNGLLKKVYFDPSALERCPEEMIPRGVNLIGQVTATQPLTGRVRIVGLATRPEHDGQYGTVLPPGFPDQHGHVKVQMDQGSTVLDLPPSYLRPAPHVPRPPQPEDAYAPGGLCIGDRVQVRNLAGRPQHNGRTAVVEAVDPSTGTVTVVFEGDAVEGVLRLNLSPNYLAPLGEAAARIASNPTPAPTAPFAAAAPMERQFPPQDNMMRMVQQPAAPQLRDADSMLRMVQQPLAPQLREMAPAVSALQSGDRVIVKNWTFRPELNGQAASIEGIQGNDVFVKFFNPALEPMSFSSAYLERI